jgi:hypothetical protein
MGEKFIDLPYHSQLFKGDSAPRNLLLSWFAVDFWKLVEKFSDS